MGLTSGAAGGGKGQGKISNKGMAIPKKTLQLILYMLAVKAMQFVSLPRGSMYGI